MICRDLMQIYWEWFYIELFVLASVRFCFWIVILRLFFCCLELLGKEVTSKSFILVLRLYIISVRRYFYHCCIEALNYEMEFSLIYSGSVPYLQTHSFFSKLSQYQLKLLFIYLQMFSYLRFHKML